MFYIIKNIWPQLLSLAFVTYFMLCSVKTSLRGPHTGQTTSILENASKNASFVSKTLKSKISPNFVIYYDKYMGSIASFRSCDLFHALWYKKIITGAAYRPNRVDFGKCRPFWPLFAFLAKKWPNRLFFEKKSAVIYC